MLTDEYNSYYKIIVSSKTVSGIIQEKKTIDGVDAYRIGEGEELYKTVPGFTKALDVGNEITAYLNHKNQIVSVESGIQKSNYGYIAKWTESEGFGSPAAVQMLIPGTLTMEYEVDDSDPDNVVRTPYLKGHNAAVQELEVAENLRVNGTKYTGSLNNLFSDMSNRVVEYKLGSLPAAD